MTVSDYKKVLQYSNDQVYAFNAEQRRQAYPNWTAIRKLWPLLPPWRHRPIREQVEIWSDIIISRWVFGNENWNKPYVSRNVSPCEYKFISFLDPKLSKRIFPMMFPYTTGPPVFDTFSYTGSIEQDTHISDFAAFENGVVKQILKPYFQEDALWPLAAVIQDAQTLILANQAYHN
jgi:hypothetical protein